MKDDRPSDEVEAAYAAAQTRTRAEAEAPREALGARADAWKDPAIPGLQQRVSGLQLERLRAGEVDPVFASLAEALAAVPGRSFSLLDAACASGYYRDVIAALDPREIDYVGCDYSEAQIAAARARAPGTRFEVQDLTALGYDDRAFDVVLVSGVLEHVPAFERAIAEACRVARSHVVAHRVPLARGRRPRFTLGAQYNIETPRIWFARRPLLAEFARHGFHPVHDRETYAPRGLVSRLRAWLRPRTSRTFVFTHAR